MGHSNTSVNSIVKITIPGVYNSPQTIQGYGPDEGVVSQAITTGTTVVGLDGKLATAYTFSTVPIEITLLPNSDSVKIFNDWAAAELQAREKLVCMLLIKYPSIKRTWTMLHGSLENRSGPESIRKTLDNLKYTIVFSSANMIGEEG